MSQSIESNTEIKFVRLNTGEDVVTQLEHVKLKDDEYYVLTNPLKIVYLVGDKKNSIYLSFMEWVFPRICIEQRFQIFPSDVLTIGEITEDLREYYEEALFKFSDNEASIKFLTKKKSKSENEIDLEMLLENNVPEPSDEDIEQIRKIMDDLQKSKRNLH